MFFDLPTLSGSIQTLRVDVRDGESLLAALKRSAEVETKMTRFGEQIISINGVRSDNFQFLVVDERSGARGFAYVVLPNGQKLFVDLPHMEVPKSGTFRIAFSIMSFDDDFENSVKEKVDASFPEFQILSIEELKKGLEKIVGKVVRDWYLNMPQTMLLPLLGGSKLQARNLQEYYLAKMLEKNLQQSIAQFGGRGAISDGEKTGFKDVMNFSFDFQLKGGERLWSSKDFETLSDGLPAVLSENSQRGENEMLPVSKSSKGYLGVSDSRAKGSKADGKGSKNNPRSDASKKARVGGQSDGGLENRKRKQKKHLPVSLSALKSFKAVIFDLDGVAVNSEKTHLKTFNKTLAPLGIKISERMWKRNYTGIGSNAIMDDVFARNKITENAHGWVAARADVYQKHVERHGLPEISGFKDFNKFLLSQGVATAVASGGHNSHIAASLQSLGLPKMLFVGQENVKRAKPSPELFLLAAKRLKVKPSECIVFEDSLAGIEAARRAGMPCISLSTTLPKNELKGKAALIVRNFKSSALRKLVLSLLKKRRGR